MPMASNSARRSPIASSSSAAPANSPAGSGRSPASTNSSRTPWAWIRSSSSPRCTRSRTRRGGGCGAAAAPARVSRSVSSSVASSPRRGEAVTVTLTSVGRWASTCSSTPSRGITSKRAARSNRARSSAVIADISGYQRAALDISDCVAAVSTDSQAPSVELEADRAYVQLRDRIVTLRLAPGTVLREDELMRELDVGRTPLREAVKRLALENLVAVQPRRGTFVCAVEAADIVNINEVRAELEGYAAALAAQRLDDDHRAAAQALLREVEELGETGDQDWLMRFDERIHRFTWEATGNPYLIETLERYFTHSLRIWYLVLDRLPGLGHAVHDQARLVEALLAGDADHARELMREHVLDFQRELLAAFSRSE